MIKHNVETLLKTLPAGVRVVAAAKTRTSGEIMQAIEAGIKVIGQNYVQEAVERFRDIGSRAEWHFIGRLQKNKIKKAVQIFDMIESVDSLGTAIELDRRCAEIKKTMEVLVEANSGREEEKSGLMLEEVENAVRGMAELSNLRVMGLMTMGPAAGPGETGECFKRTRRVFEDIGRKNIRNVEMKWLSMGMSDSYRIAINEGANMVRIGTLIFGEREHK